MDIFTEVNQLGEKEVATKIGLEVALDGKSFKCPICGHGKGGNGVRQKYNNHFGRLNWWCHTCNRNYSNSDLIAAVEEINPCDVSALAKRLRQMFALGVQDETKNSFSSTRKVVEPLADKAPRNFSKLYQYCREKYSLKKFVDKCGGKWRGLTLKTLQDANCLFHAAYTYDRNKPACPAIIVPYSDSLFYWRRVDEVPEGEPKCGVPTGVKRKPYIAAPLTGINLIVEGELDALSIWQALRDLEVGIIATGGAQFFRPTVAEIQRQFEKSARRPSFIVMHDNDEAGRKNGDAMTALLRASGFPTEQYYFASRMKGEYVGAHGVTKYQPKIDANSMLEQGEEILIQRLADILDEASVWLDLQAERMRRQKS